MRPSSKMEEMLGHNKLAQVHDDISSANKQADCLHVCDEEKRKLFSPQTILVAQ